MNYKKYNVDKTKERIESEDFVSYCKNNEKDFIRKRKVTPQDIALYQINKRGLSTKMEILNFNNINDVQNISSPGLFKQREKLNPEAFTYLIQESLKDFYHKFPNEVKTYKGYVLKAIDGSDFEIPNTKRAREKYNGKQQKQCARVTVSTCYDVLNKYTLDTIVSPYNYSETEMFKKHLETINEKNILGEFKSISIADRNYKNLSFFYQAIKNKELFLIRISSAVYEKENQAMTTDDENIEIKYEYNRIRYYKDKDPELYNYYMNGNTIKLRCVKIILDTGEIEYLLTNLDSKEFSTKEIKELYNLRWKIELNYKHLKNNLKIECITSSKEILIKQDIYSQVLVANMLQSFINDGNEVVSEFKYKNKVKINNNMAIGIFKNTLIYIFLEEDNNKRAEMMDRFLEAIVQYIVPIKPGRKNERNTNSKNRYHINQRKTF